MHFVRFENEVSLEIVHFLVFVCEKNKGPKKVGIAVRIDRRPRSHLGVVVEHDGEGIAFPDVSSRKEQQGKL